MMKRIYSVGNSRHMSCWILADSPEQAAQIALAIGHVRKVTAARASDMTDELIARPGCRSTGVASLQVLRARDGVGLLTKRIPRREPFSRHTYGDAKWVLRTVVL